MGGWLGGAQLVVFRGRAGVGVVGTAIVPCERAPLALFLLGVKGVCVGMRGGGVRVEEIRCRVRLCEGRWLKQGV